MHALTYHIALHVPRPLLSTPYILSRPKLTISHMCSCFSIHFSGSQRLGSQIIRLRQVTTQILMYFPRDLSRVTTVGPTRENLIPNILAMLSLENQLRIHSFYKKTWLVKGMEKAKFEPQHFGSERECEDHSTTPSPITHFADSSKRWQNFENLSYWAFVVTSTQNHRIIPI